MKYVKFRTNLLIFCVALILISFFTGLYDSFYAGPNSNALSIFKYVIPFLKINLTFLLGAIIFLTRFPEKFIPNYFNVFNSHVIWHMVSFYAIILSFQLDLDLFYERAAQKCIKIE